MKFRVKSTLKYSVQRMTPTKAVRIALLVISDALILNIASFLALWVRFEFHFEQLVRETEYLNNILRFAPYYTAFGLIVFALFKLLHKPLAVCFNRRIFKNNPCVFYC